MKLSLDMGPEFEKWQKLTDEYAEELSAMQRGDLSGRPRLNRLAREILRLSSNSSDMWVQLQERPAASRGTPARQ